jgi:hypothetical protein
MATQTPRLDLRKPGTGDFINVITDLDNNFDKLDQAATIDIENTFEEPQIFLDGVSVGAGAPDLAFGFVDIENSGANGLITSNHGTLPDSDLLLEAKGAGRVKVKTPVWHNVGAVDEPEFQTNWVNYVDDDEEVVRFCIDTQNFVHIEGAAKDGDWVINTVVFTLPVGFRPLKRHTFLTNCNAASPSGDIGVAKVRVFPNGEVLVANGFGFDDASVRGSTSDWLILDGIIFSVE